MKEFPRCLLSQTRLERSNLNINKPLYKGAVSSLYLLTDYFVPRSFTAFQ